MQYVATIDMGLETTSFFYLDILALYLYTGFVAEEATYKINQDPLPAPAKCECGHPMAAHGTRGMVCGAGRCICKLFKLKGESK